MEARPAPFAMPDDLPSGPVRDALAQGLSIPHRFRLIGPAAQGMYLGPEPRIPAEMLDPVSNGPLMFVAQGDDLTEAELKSLRGSVPPITFLSEGDHDAAHEGHPLSKAALPMNVLGTTMKVACREELALIELRALTHWQGDGVVERGCRRQLGIKLAAMTQAWGAKVMGNALLWAEFPQSKLHHASYPSIVEALHEASEDCGDMDAARTLRELAWQAKALDEHHGRGEPFDDSQHHHVLELWETNVLMTMPEIMTSKTRWRLYAGGRHGRPTGIQGSDVESLFHAADEAGLLNRSHEREFKVVPVFPGLSHEHQRCSSRQLEIETKRHASIERGAAVTL